VNNSRKKNAPPRQATTRPRFSFIPTLLIQYRTHHRARITFSQAALVMLRQPLALPNHCTFIVTEPGCDFSFWFIFLLRENGAAFLSTLKTNTSEKQKEHPLTIINHSTLPNEKQIFNYLGQIFALLDLKNNF
jgi:hypothetical protein